MDEVKGSTTVTNEVKESTTIMNEVKQSATISGALRLSDSSSQALISQTPSERARQKFHRGLNVPYLFPGVQSMGMGMGCDVNG